MRTETLMGLVGFIKKGNSGDFIICVRLFLKELTEIDQQINSAEREFRELEEKRSWLLKKIKSLNLN